MMREAEQQQQAYYTNGGQQQAYYSNGVQPVGGYGGGAFMGPGRMRFGQPGVPMASPYGQQVMMTSQYGAPIVMTPQYAQPVGFASPYAPYGQAQPIVLAPQSFGQQPMTAQQPPQYSELPAAGYPGQYPAEQQPGTVQALQPQPQLLQPIGEPGDSYLADNTASGLSNWLGKDGTQ